MWGQPMDAGKTPTQTQVPAQAAPAPPTFPMSVDDFLAGGYLERSDVILTRKHRDLTSWLIRFLTGSQFSHAALVFLVPRYETGFNKTFVIEAGTSGVDLAKLDDYLRDRRSVVGIRRLRHPWFQDDASSLVRGRMLNNIEADYAFRTIFTILFDILNKIGFGVSKSIYGKRKAMKRRKKRNRKAPNEFICSGLVQLGYVEGVGELVWDGYLPVDVMSEIIFEPNLAALLQSQDWDQFTRDEQLEIVQTTVEEFQDELAAITPEHIAASPMLDWRYVVRNQIVHEVSSDEEANALLDWSPSYEDGMAVP